MCIRDRTLLAEHYVNEGGAVSIRNATEEKKNIKRLRSKWPGVFLGSPRGDSEVRLIWDKRDVVLGGNRVFETYDVRGKLTVYDKEYPSLDKRRNPQAAVVAKPRQLIASKWQTPRTRRSRARARRAPHARGARQRGGQT